MFVRDLNFKNKEIFFMDSVCTKIPLKKYN